MNRIILFRFHENQAVCRDRVNLLRQHNPGTPIYGLYGGGETLYPRVEQSFAGELAHLYCLRGKTATWKWLNGDLAIREWHQAVGRALDFDMLHVVEWDLVLLDSLEKIYGGVPKGGLAITGLVPLRAIKDKWIWPQLQSWWVPQWERLLAHSRENYDYEAEPYASLGPGLALPKTFLDLYADGEVPELCHDEVRLPLFAQNFGFDLYDTGFYQGWFDARAEAFFNCTNQEVGLEVIRSELANPGGRRAFHPCRAVYGPPQAASASAGERTVVEGL
jgi:hypothetical protein